MTDQQSAEPTSQVQPQIVSQVLTQKEKARLRMMRISQSATRDAYGRLRRASSLGLLWATAQAATARPVLLFLAKCSVPLVCSSPCEASPQKKGLQPVPMSCAPNGLERELKLMVDVMSQSDPEILYFTLVQDDILPRGFLQPFLDSYATVDLAAKRGNQSLSKIDNASAAVALHLRAAQAQKNAPKALSVPPAKKLTLKFKHSLEEAALCSNSIARRDAEALERRRGIDALAQLLLNTPTPMGRLLSADPSCRNVPQLRDELLQRALPVFSGALSFLSQNETF